MRKIYLPAPQEERFPEIAPPTPFAAAAPLVVASTALKQEDDEVQVETLPTLNCRAEDEPTPLLLMVDSPLISAEIDVSGASHLLCRNQLSSRNEATGARLMLTEFERHFAHVTAQCHYPASQRMAEVPPRFEPRAG